MSGSFNLFGATVAGLLKNYKTGSYTPVSDEFGGDDVVIGAMAQAEGQLLDAMPPNVFQNLAHPDLCQVVSRAVAGQTEFELPSIFLPAKTNSVHLWTGHPSIFITRPKKRTDPFYSGAYASLGSPTPYPAVATAPVELVAGSFIVDHLTGLVTVSTPLQEDWLVFASFDVDVSSEDYSVPSLASIVENAAAGELGAKLYSRTTDDWALVEKFNKDFTDAIEAMGKGERVPPELRMLRWWQEVEKTQINRPGSTRIYRG
jgi:hypothetical protein